MRQIIIWAVLAMSLPGHVRALDDEGDPTVTKLYAQATAALAKTRQAEACAAIEREVASPVAAEQRHALEAIAALLNEKDPVQVTDTCKHLAEGWIAKLAAIGLQNEALSLAKRAILARPCETVLVEQLLTRRIELLLARNAGAEALSETKALLNVVSLEHEDAVRELALRTLKVLKPETVNLDVFKSVKAYALEYDTEILNARMGSFDELSALGNLMLLVDQPRAARTVFERALLVAGDQQREDGMRNVARAIKCGDGNAGRAQAWLKKALATFPGKADPPPRPPAPPRDQF